LEVADGARHGVRVDKRGQRTVLAEKTLLNRRMQDAIWGTGTHLLMLAERDPADLMTKHSAAITQGYVLLLF
jgi:hypothetical protein